MTDLLASDLSKLISGQIRFREIDRALYSTDASIYQVQPIGVVVPNSIDEAATVLRFCAERRVPVLPRGGGTSLAGQCTNHALVLDLSAMCRRIISIDPAARICHVEAGATIDEINRELAPHNLFYAPDPATSAHAAIAGTIGNNAAGARSLRYGRTSENLAAVEIVLCSGERAWLEDGAGQRDAVALRLCRGVAEICLQHADQIRARFPKTIRRNAGYGLDMILKQLDAGVAVEELDLTGLICGSEGTLALVVAAKLKLLPAPIARALAIVSFRTLEDAIDRVGEIVATRPTAVELIDENVIEAAAHNLGTQPLLSLLPTVGGSTPRTVLYVEYTAENSLDEIDAGFAALRNVCAAHPMIELRDRKSLDRAWALRKAGEPLLHGMSARRKPQTFVEDNAIPIEHLPRFVREMKAIVQRHGTTAAFWAHASVGVLHIRPMIDLHEKHDRAIMQSIAIEVADLARTCGGVMSGEHGDGRLRGPLLEQFFGADLMTAFREIKQLFDPRNIFNPGDIVAPGPVESITTHLRVLPDEKPARVPNVETFFSYDDQHGFDGAVEMCNGAGFCRKTAGGTMCPSYRATLDEQHSTRGRANALRLAITGQLERVWDDPGTIETLDLCLSCKACKTECPSNVDVARLKAEYTAQRFRDHGAPIGAKLFGHVRTINRLGSALPGLFNLLSRKRLTRTIIDRVMGLSPKRSIPKFARALRHDNPRPGAPSVLLYSDCFTTYSDPHIGRAAIRVLESLGYEVRLPRVGCCGRAMISTGLMRDAIRTADATIEKLLASRADAIVVCEPSCLSAIKDDWLHMKLRAALADRNMLARKSFLVEDFVERFWDQHPNRPNFTGQTREVILHGHCHQKALWGDQTSSAALQRFARVNVLDSGCCGMAGSFGYTADHFDLSMKIGELSVFPPIRAASRDAIIVAPGTSCRHQIRDGTGREALHPIELIDDAISSARTTTSR